MHDIVKANGLALNNKCFGNSISGSSCYIE